MEEVGIVDPEIPETDGLLTVGRFGADNPIGEINPSQRFAWQYAHGGSTSGDPSNPNNWVEFRTLAMFDLSEISDPYEVVSLRIKLKEACRHQIGNPTFQIAAYPGNETSYPFDLETIYPPATWGDLGGYPNIVEQVYTVEELITILGGSDTSLTNLVQVTDEEAIDLEFTFLNSSWASGNSGGAVGIVMGIISNSFPGTLDTASFPNAGIDPSDHVFTIEHRLVIEVGGEVVEVDASDILTFQAQIDVIIREDPLHHFARLWRNTYRR